ncbi:MAG: AEC family transporter [Clostridiales bacterium]|nr:AEC family transporter [Clostridiales bacterium]
MTNTFFYAFNAVMPIMLLIALGYFVRHMGFGSDSFFTLLNRLCFHLFLPVQLFTNMLSIHALSDVNWLLMLCCLVGFLLCLAVGYLASHFLIRDPRQKGVILQSSFRSNQAIIGIVLSQALGGAEAVAVASVASAIFVPIFNVLAVVVLTLYSGKRETLSGKKLLLDVVKNPLIIGIAAGLLVVFVRQSVPGITTLWQACFSRFTILDKLLESLSQIASPLMLIALGARFDLKAAGNLAGKVALGTVLRLIVSPIFGLGLAILLRVPLGLTGGELAGLIALFASPVAISSAVMVQEIGGDEQLANQLVVWSSILSMVTLFLLAYLLRTTGLI